MTTNEWDHRLALARIGEKIINLVDEEATARKDFVRREKEFQHSCGEKREIEITAVGDVALTLVTNKDDYIPISSKRYLHYSSWDIWRELRNICQRWDTDMYDLYVEGQAEEQIVDLNDMLWEHAVLFLGHHRRPWTKPEHVLPGEIVALMGDGIVFPKKVETDYHPWIGLEGKDIFLRFTTAMDNVVTWLVEWRQKLVEWGIKCGTTREFQVVRTERKTEAMVMATIGRAL